MASRTEDADQNSAQGPSTQTIRPSSIIVKELPKFDLDSYILNYDGLTRLDRLITIGTSSKPLATDAITLAIREARAGRNIGMYVALCEYAATYLDGSAAAGVTLDAEWAEQRRRQVAAEGERLEHELKGYKNNLIKESIRMGNEEVGMHCYARGELAAAWRHLNKMREYCTTPKHVAEMCLKLVLVAVAQGNWLNVQSSVYKIQALQLHEDDRERIDPALPPILGLAHLAAGNYSAAAQAFLSTPSAFIALEPVAGIDFPRHLLSPNDLAVYASLCALATYDRARLQTAVLDNADFRSFLELEPHMRRAIAAFVASKYTAALAILDAYKPDYLLDVYLQRHVSELYTLIRRKSIVSYFAPFSRASIAAMGAAFGVHDPVEMEAELVGMVRRGELDARVDAVDKVLVGVHVDEREKVLQDALQHADDAEKGLRLRLMRVNLSAAGWEVKGEGPGVAKKKFGGMGAFVSR